MSGQNNATQAGPNDELLKDLETALDAVTKDHIKDFKISDVKQRFAEHANGTIQCIIATARE